MSVCSSADDGGMWSCCKLMPSMPFRCDFVHNSKIYENHKFFLVLLPESEQIQCLCLGHEDVRTNHKLAPHLLLANISILSIEFCVQQQFIFLSYYFTALGCWWNRLFSPLSLYHLKLFTHTNTQRVLCHHSVGTYSISIWGTLLPFFTSSCLKLLFLVYSSVLW